jgi:tRNA-specific 2-thiouridylase
MARRPNLPVAEKAESMEICFVPTGDYRDVLRERRPEVFSPGAIVNQEGKVLGEHGGTALFTVGQRRGLPGGQGRPIFVTEVRPETNTVVVGREEDVRTTTFLVHEVVFSGASEGSVGSSLEGVMKIRSHHDPVAASVTFMGEGKLSVVAHEPLFAVTPGQSAVLYDKDRVLLGGTITRGSGLCV